MRPGREQSGTVVDKLDENLMAKPSFVSTILCEPIPAIALLVSFLAIATAQESRFTR